MTPLMGTLLYVKISNLMDLTENWWRLSSWDKNYVSGHEILIRGHRAPLKTPYLLLRKQCLKFN